jgi:6-phosphogluconolactonase (cycloisomerase 2 family)
MNERRGLVKSLSIMALVAVFGAALVLATPSASADDGLSGAVYTMTNNPGANAVLQYDRLPDGSLQYRDTYMTGGLGSGDGLGNQGGVVLSEDGRWLLVVNAGSHEVSVFANGKNGLTLTDTEDSGGVRPISVAIHRDLVYVVHAGGAVGDVDSVSALRLNSHGGLTPLPGSSVSLSAASSGPAQIAFSPDGRFVLVTEKATNTLSVFQLDADGYADTVVFNPSEGGTPFAFDFGTRDRLFVSEVFGGADDGGAVSSYELLRDGTLETISASVPNTETAPCWLVVSKGGRYAFTTNTPDDSLSAYAIGSDGQIGLVDPDGRTGEPGAGTRPLDMDLSRDGRHLFTLNIGDGTISTFRVGPDGSLTLTSTVDGVPSGVNGLAAR